MVKIGLIGFGSWVKSSYLPALKYDGRSIVTAVTASSEKTKKYAKQVLGEAVTIYKDYQSLLESSQIDAVMVAVPDKLHQEVLSAALKAKVPVFYEPPISLVRNQTPHIIEQLLQASVISFAHLELGYHPVFERAKQLIDKGWLGALQSVCINLNASWGVDEKSDLCLLDRMSCWYIDVLNNVIGSLPQRVLLLEGHVESNRMQAQSIGIYDYDSIWGIFKANVAAKGKASITVEITGQNGCINIDYFSGKIKYKSGLDMNQDDFEELVLPLTPYADYPAVRECVTAFIDAVIQKDINRGNMRKVAQLSEIGLAIDTSRDSGTWAQVKKI